MAATLPEVERGEVEKWEQGLDELHGRIAHHFRRTEVRQRARRYLGGLLGHVDRKNGWQMAEHLGETGPRGVQRLLNGAVWDAEAVRDDLRRYVVEQLGDDEAVGVLDETGFLKKGTKSVGVQRQYYGTTGSVENCQVGVFLAYASPKGKAFVDRALYLPRAWAADRVRRAEAGVPRHVRFATKPELARQMLDRAFAAGVALAWVTGDEVYGKDAHLRRWLEKKRQAYVLEVACNHLVWQDGCNERVDVVISHLPETAWTTLSAGEGSQGPRLFDWTVVDLAYESIDGMHHALLARRSLSDATEIAYFLVFGPLGIPLAKLAQVAGTRWTVEECFEQSKGIVGLDQYEVRRWNAWYRHITLALLAHAYLAVTRHTAQTVAPSDAVNEKGGHRQRSSL